MTIVITLPEFIDQEAGLIVQLLDRGDVDIVHIRKPSASLQQVEALVRDIPESYRTRLVLHDHHSLAEKYGLYGVHLNGRNPLPPKDWTGNISRSCHTLDEVELWKDRCSYVSLSPIFDSVSKQGYLSAFKEKDIQKACAVGIIDEKVYALGGVTFDKLDYVKKLGFGGAMILGDAWRQY